MIDHNHLKQELARIQRAMWQCNMLPEEIRESALEGLRSRKTKILASLIKS